MIYFITIYVIIINGITTYVSMIFDVIMIYHFII